jgi:hypothetical protein
MLLQPSLPIPVDAVPPPPDGQGSMLKVPWIGQAAMDLWCWAACGAMILGYYGEQVQPCDIATRRLGTPCCPQVSACNQRCKLGLIASIYSDWGHQAHEVCDRIDAATIKCELDAGRPVQLATSEHTVVLYGWTPTPDGDSFWFHDPQFEEGHGAVFCYRYANFNVFLSGRWIDTWTGIQ